MKNTLLIFLLLGVAVAACNKEDDYTPPAQQTSNTTTPGSNNPERITRMVVLFTDSAQPASQVLVTYVDTSLSDTVTPPLHTDTIRLDANRTYFLDILYFNDGANPVDTVSNEIMAEANDHQVFFHFNMLTAISGYRDLDSQSPPQPLGLRSFWHTGSPGSGGAAIILKHQPGTKTGNEASGQLDFEARMPMIIQ